MSEDEKAQADAGSSAEDRSRHLADPLREIDLAEAARALREDGTWQREGHSAQTLVKNESLHIVLIDMRSGARLEEHRTPSRISIHVLTGRISVSIPGGRSLLAAGRLLALDESIPHDVEALEPSTFLLTIAREPDKASDAGVH